MAKYIELQYRPRGIPHLLVDGLVGFRVPGDPRKQAAARQAIRVLQAENTLARAAQNN